MLPRAHTTVTSVGDPAGPNGAAQLGGHTVPLAGPSPSAAPAPLMTGGPGAFDVRSLSFAAAAPPVGFHRHHHHAPTPHTIPQHHEYHHHHQHFYQQMAMPMPPSAAGPYPSTASPSPPMAAAYLAQHHPLPLPLPPPPFSAPLLYHDPRQQQQFTFVQQGLPQLPHQSQQHPGFTAVYNHHLHHLHHHHHHHHQNNNTTSTPLQGGVSMYNQFVAQGATPLLVNPGATHPRPTPHIHVQPSPSFSAHAATRSLHHHQHLQYNYYHPGNATPPMTPHGTTTQALAPPPSMAGNSSGTGGLDEMLHLKQHVAGGRITSEAVVRAMQDGTSRREVQLKGQAHIILHLRAQPAALPPYCSEAAADAATKPENQEEGCSGSSTSGAVPPPQPPQPAATPPPPPPPCSSTSFCFFVGAAAKLPPSTVVVVEITQMRNLPTPQCPHPRRRLLGCFVVFETMPGILAVDVREAAVPPDPPAPSETIAPTPVAAAAPAAQFLDRKPDRIWLILRGVLSHTPPSLWAQYAALRLSPALCVHREVAVALRRIGLAAVADAVPTAAGRAVHDVPMSAILALRESFEAQASGGLVL